MRLVALNDDLTSVPLDLGDHFFPLDTPLGWFMGLPPKNIAPNLFFSWANQVKDLQWKSDADRLEALLKYQRGDEAHLTHYEVESNTLIIRPLRPLKPKQRYAVLLSNEIKGWQSNGEYGPIQSAFPLPMSSKDYERLTPYQSAINASLNNQELAFAWTFTKAHPPICSIKSEKVCTVEVHWLN